MTKYNSTAQDHVQKVFNLSRQELAKACKVTVKVLDSWRDKTVIDGEGRLWPLFQVSHAWKEQSCEDLDSETSKLKLLREETIFDLLCREKIDQDLILFCGVRLLIGYWDRVRARHDKALAGAHAQNKVLTARVEELEGLLERIKQWSTDAFDELGEKFDYGEKP